MERVLGWERTAKLEIGEHHGAERFSQFYAVVPRTLVAGYTSHEDQGPLRCVQQLGAVGDQVSRRRRRRGRSVPGNIRQGRRILDFLFLQPDVKAYIGWAARCGL